MELKEIEKKYFAFEMFFKKLDKIEKQIRKEYDSKLLNVVEVLKNIKNDKLTLPEMNTAVKYKNFYILNKNRIYMLFSPYKKTDTQKVKEIAKKVNDEFYIKDYLTKTDLNNMIKNEFKKIKELNGLKITVKNFTTLSIEEQFDFLDKYGSDLPGLFEKDGYKTGMSEYIAVNTKIPNAQEAVNEYSGFKKRIDRIEKDLNEKGEIFALAVIKEMKEKAKNYADESKNILEKNIPFLRDNGSFVTVNKKISIFTEKPLNDIILFKNKPDTSKIANKFNLFKEGIKLLDVSHKAERIQSKIETLENFNNKIRKEYGLKENFKCAL